MIHFLNSLTKIIFLQVFSQNHFFYKFTKKKNIYIQKYKIITKELTRSSEKMFLFQSLGHRPSL
jgi:hypothetical protein